MGKALQSSTSKVNSGGTTSREIHPPPKKPDLFTMATRMTQGRRVSLERRSATLPDSRQPPRSVTDLVSLAEAAPYRMDLMAALLALTATFLGSVSAGFPGMFPYEWQTCRECMPVTCGLPRNPWDRQGRAYGGVNSSRGRYPWHAIIYANDVPIGAGALISCKLVITTAYLVQDHTSQDLVVKLGKVDMENVSPAERSFKVFQKLLHPLWNADRDLYANDLALLLLERRVDFESFNGYINTVCLPVEGSDARGWLTLTGFGYDLAGKKKNVLQELDIKKLPQDQCPLFRHKPHNFCGLGKHAGICAGDRGSPIVQVTPSGQYVLVGVANDYQCKAGGSDVYTQISFFLNFICNAPVLP